MNALVIDTSSWISFLAGGGPELVQQALDERRVYLPPVVAAELLSGRLSASDRRALTSLLDDLPLVQADRAHWYRVGRLRASLGQRGLAVSTPDAHLAQCALDLGAELLTEDRIFSKVAGRAGLMLAVGS